VRKKLVTTDSPKDPFGAFAEGAVAMHEIFTEYVKAGFSRAESLKIVIALLTNIQTNSPPAGGDANE
jgi:hypothetical protein